MVNNNIREGRPGARRPKPTYDRFVSAVSDYVRQLDPRGNQTEPAQDVHQSANLHLLSPGQQGTLSFGRLISAMPRLNWYRVQLEGAGGDFPCCRLSADAGVTPLGTKDGSILQPNAMVLVYKHPTSMHGVILGSVPDIVQDGNQTFSDCISQGSGTGFAREGYYKDLFSLLENDGGMTDFSADRPLDQSCLDWTKITELGGRIHLDPFLLQFMLDEMCGLQLHYHDQLARLNGYNLDIRSAMHSLSIRDDDGECQLQRGETLYPWEIYGAFGPDKTTHRETPTLDVLYNKPYGVIEPTHNDQIPFFRFQEYGGYLGQGHMRQMCLPPTSTTEDVLRLGRSTKLPGVFREQIFPTGAYALESAKSVIIAKRAPIPIPVPKKLPEDYSENADNPSNYKASGKTGSGDDHVVKDLQPEGELPNLLAAASIMDQHAYTFNWQGLHPFHYHAKDYSLPQEADLPLNSVETPASFRSLASQQWLDRPSPVRLKVDDRYGNVDYFKVLSHLSLLDDGSLVLGGGGGCALKFTAGSVELSCPGDIWLRSGRSVLQWAGDDIVLKAQNSIDVTSSNKDVRLKAENNLELLGGNSGQGGVLIESKAESTTYDYEGLYGEDVSGSGIVLKSAKGQFAVLAAGVYLRTGSSAGQIGSGKIVLDADKGQADIVMVCSNLDQYIEGKNTVTFGVEQPRAVNKFESSKAMFGMRVDVNGQMAVNGNGMFIAGNVNATGDFSGNGLAAAFGKVGYLSTNPASLAQVTARLDGVESTNQTNNGEASSNYQQYVAAYYAQGKIGSDAIERSLAVTLRTMIQYGTQDFRLPESPWQQQATASGQFQTWTETVVRVAGRELMPYPGTEKWRDQDTYFQVTTTLYDSATGRDVDRGEDYEDPAYGEWTRQKLDGNYPVTK